MVHLNGYWRVGLLVVGLLGLWGAVRPSLLAGAPMHQHIAARAF
jgi:hypothetical protein